MTGSQIGPARPEERIEALDILRGVALFGVLIVNLVNEFRVSIFQQFLKAEAPAGFADRIVQAFVHYALELKAFALFALLFGIGLAIQRERLAGTGRPSYWLARRLGVLFALGLVHLLLIWNGDILTEYALAGLLVLPFLGARNWVLAAASAALFAFHFSSAILIPFPEAAWIRTHVAEANQAYATGSLMEVRSFSLHELPAIALLHAHIFARTLALFFLGALAWRLRIFGRRNFLLSIAVAGLLGGIALGIPGASESSVRISQVLLALGYAGVVLLLARFLRVFAPIGRMAFTNYLLQSLVLGWIFYGYGLGLFGKLGVTAAFALGVAIYIAQIVLSIWWLKRFRFGPVEWLWRSLMYGKRQPWR